MKDLGKLFFNIYSVNYFLIIFVEGLAFLGKINTRVYTKLLPQYQTVQKCAGPTKNIFCHLEQVKIKFYFGEGGGLHKHPGWCLSLLTKQGGEFVFNSYCDFYRAL